MEQKTESTSCEQCRWYKPSATNKHYGRCHRYAPHPQLGITKWQKTVYADWPHVYMCNICGDFKKK
ncbi:MAG: hypothetical protein BWY31_04631 [Lentisphaerae bacterium ADurb.Bin242]|nr:MAG: hypothetical protein BWY31_04631 [Lentisphaerae bacterium ADurb.Bin242]